MSLANDGTACGLRSLWGRRIFILSYILMALAFAVCAAIYICRSSFLLPDGKRYFCLFDDAMISMRYAWNFTHGNGLVWNPDQRVEGYTNPLMVLLMSAVMLFAGKSISCLVIQILGALFMVAVAGLASLITIRLSCENLAGDLAAVRASAPRLSGLLVFAATLCYYPLAFWSIMGMETGLLTVLLVTAVCLSVRPGACTPYRLLLISILLGLAYLSRPDAVVTALVLVIYLCARLAQEASRSRIVCLLALALPFVCLVTSHVIFRWYYYGQLLPNTYTLKVVGLCLSERMRNGLLFITPFVKYGWPLYAVCGIACVLNFSYERLLLMILSVALVGYQILIGGDAWQRWRMLVPSIPLLLAVAVPELLRIVQILWHARSGGQYMVGRPMSAPSVGPQVIASGLLMAIVVALNWTCISEIRTLRPYAVEANKRNVHIAQALRRVMKPQATVGVIWAGAIPYYSGLRGVDFLGKNDKTIAARMPDTSGAVSWGGMFTIPGHNKYDLNYSIKKLKPDYVQRARWGRDDITAWVEARYISVDYRGARLRIKRRSPNVMWDRVFATSPSLRAH